MQATPPLSRRQWLGHAIALAGASGASLAQNQTPAWAALEAKARGQTVFFNAWGGSDRINAYLQWAAGRMQERHGLSIEHVKLTDTVEAVKRVRNEKQAGKIHSGSVDAIWINGENFLSMKREELLFGPFAEKLPNFAFVDVQGKPTTRLDFSEPVAGMEAPWGMAQFTWFADSKRVPELPRSMAALAEFAKAHPGRLSYPRPPNFHGTTFLKQALVELNADRSALYRPFATEPFARTTEPLWTWLDALHPSLWRKGRQFPQNAAAIRQMMADGELLIALTFNPNEAANEIAANRLPASVVSWQNSAGSIANTHFLAIPYNATAPEAAQVFINFLLSPEAQARKADSTVWGDPTVLALDKLSASERARFNASPLPGMVAQSAPAIPEPHGSWVDPLEREWLRRYGQ